MSTGSEINFIQTAGYILRSYCCLATAYALTRLRAYVAYATRHAYITGNIGKRKEKRNTEDLKGSFIGMHVGEGGGCLSLDKNNISDALWYILGTIIHMMYTYIMIVIALQGSQH